jgi:hypothetical protein
VNARLAGGGTVLPVTADGFDLAAEAATVDGLIPDTTGGRIVWLDGPTRERVRTVLAARGLTVTPTAAEGMLLAGTSDRLPQPITREYRTITAVLAWLRQPGDDTPERTAGLLRDTDLPAEGHQPHDPVEQVACRLILDLLPPATTCNAHLPLFIHDLVTATYGGRTRLLDAARLAVRS